MKLIGNLVFILLAGLLLISNQCSGTGNTFLLNGHRSGVFFNHKGGPKDAYANGIVPMFQTIGDNAAIYGLFHFEHNSFAANTTKNMLATAIETKHPNKEGTKVNWKSFLETELANIKKRLMRKDLTETEAKSTSRASIVIVDENRVIQARIGNGRIAIFVNDPSLRSSNKLRLREKNPSKELSKLGGQCDKADSAIIIRGDAEVYEIKDDVKYIVLGTNHFWFANINEITESIYDNENDLNDAAQAITELFKPPNAESDRGVIVIAMGYPTIKKRPSRIHSLVRCVKP